MKYYKWIAIIDELTCEDCRAMDNHIFPEDKLNQLLPLHGKDKGHVAECRCVYKEVEVIDA